MKNKQYELMVIVAPEENETDITKMMEGLLTEFGLDVSEKDVWGLRTLAYPIKGKVQGRYIIYKLNVAADKNISEASKELSMKTGILRHKFFLLGGE